MLATIGYEKSTPEDFITTLQEQGIEVLVDIRDRAQSRRRGFSKTALATAAENAGIEYIHFRALGDPKEGRDAARSGQIDKFIEIFTSVLAERPAQEALAEVAELAKSRTICLMCYERDHRHCHRKIVSDELEVTLGCRTIHLGVPKNASERRRNGRVLHTCEGTTA